jgi:predicted nucleotidyltransferase
MVGGAIAMVALQDIRNRRDEIERLARQHGASRLRIFGSLARGEGRSSSDLDLLVHMDENRSLIDRVALQQAMKDLLGVDVDVVNDRALHPAVRERVERDLVEL